jgi:hypothetical protein
MPAHTRLGGLLLGCPLVHGPVPRQHRPEFLPGNANRRRGADIVGAECSPSGHPRPVAAAEARVLAVEYRALAGLGERDRRHDAQDDPNGQ